MPVGGEVKGIQQFDWWKIRGRSLGLDTSGQTPKVKGLQSTYMVAVFGTIGTKSLASWQEWKSKLYSRSETLFL